MVFSCSPVGVTADHVEMIMRILSALVFVFLLVAGTASGSPRDTEVIELAVGERTREYIVFVPPGALESDTDTALVIAMHGGGGSAEHSVRELRGTLFPLAESEKFIVAFPQAVNKMWDFGAGKVSRELTESVDDKKYFDELLKDVLKRYPIDHRRVFVTGISRGGQASYFMACEFPERIRAIAVVAMPLPTFMAERCRQGPAVGVVVINGTKDPLVPYNGGVITIGKKRRDEVLSTDASMALWKHRNGCYPSISIKTKINTARDRMRVEKTEWRQCSGAPVVLYKVVGGGHAWPSGKQYLPKAIVGRVNRDIDGIAEAWKFFSEFGDDGSNESAKGR